MPPVRLLWWRVRSVARCCLLLSEELLAGSHTVAGPSGRVLTPRLPVGGHHNSQGGTSCGLLGDMDEGACVADASGVEGAVQIA